MRQIGVMVRAANWDIGGCPDWWPLLVIGEMVGLDQMGGHWNAQLLCVRGALAAPIRWF